MAATLGMVELTTSELITPLPLGVDATRSGTAFDIRTRIALGGFDVGTSASAAGVAELPHYIDKMDNGVHRARILTEAFQVAEELLASPSDEADLDRASILLAHCEQIYRAGPMALDGDFGIACDDADDGLSFAAALDPRALTDIRSLLVANTRQINSWRDQIAEGERFEPNPWFSGGMLLGGADGDWLIGDTLIDCKVYAELSTPTLRGFLRQLLGYVMLDLDDALSVRSVGVWLPRQGLMPTWSLEHLLGGDPDELLPTLREGFVNATRRNQVAVHVPVSEHRKLQLLADNRNTPHAMLLALALGDDAGLRFFVGRNVSTPENTLHTLAADRYARVRSGVAMNPMTPVEMLEAFAQDTSLMVRRAAAANLGTPRHRNQTSIASIEGGQPVEAAAIGTSAATQDLVLLDSPLSAVPAARAVEIRQDRDPDAEDYGLLDQLIHLLLGGSLGWDDGLPIPRASRDWAYMTERRRDLPERLKAGLPDELKSTLMQEDQPSHIRRIIAHSLPIANPDVREKLFADGDAEIRWSALQRSASFPDDSMGDFLSELASSRTARLAFRTQGIPNHNRWRTPNEYNVQMLRTIATHPSTPPAELKLLIQEKSPEVMTALAENPQLDEEAAHLLAEKILLMRSAESREWFAASELVSDAVLDRLAQDRSVDVRLAVAENNTAPTTALQLLAEDKAFEVRVAVLANESTPGDLATAVATSLLTTAADIELHEVLRAGTRRGGLGLPPALFEDALDRLSKSRVQDPNLRLVAAGNWRTSSKTLARLAKSGDNEVRRTVAENSHTSAGVLELLAQDDEAEVRKSAARNPNLPEDALNALFLDPDLDVRIAAFRNPVADTAEDTEPAQAAAEVELAPESTPLTVADLHEMAANKRAEVRVQVAYSPKATPDILAFLGGERRSKQVRRAVAANPNTPPSVLRSLANENDAETRQAVAFNGATSIEVLADLAGRSRDMALLVALNPDVPSQILDALVEDRDPLIKFVAEAMLLEKASIDQGVRAVSTTVNDDEEIHPTSRLLGGGDSPQNLE
ncbi:hypothetical protein [Microbacterium sp. APC 3901]|uniref:hypothetical protein n=1 Tax=Microbacterium sp. APC 3901 TaxID=3035192 RepID=UPI0025B5BED6|nr:hypothetical protein [Microbacterium sp. APC 3901]